FVKMPTSTQISTLSLHDALPIFFGVIQRVTWNGRFYWIGPEAPGTAVYTFGPFTNRAHFAGLVVAVLPVALVMLLTRRRDPLQRSEEHTSELQSRSDLVCRLLLE